MERENLYWGVGLLNGPVTAMSSTSSLANTLKDFWYIAAESAELKSRPVGKTILGERVVLFRQADNTPAALIDRCAHRNMALSRGRLRNGLIECSYHGWRYRGDGRCAHIPSFSEGAPPAENITVRSYPTAERDGYVWIYTGSGNPVRPPRPFPHCNEPGWTTFRMKTRFGAGAFSCLENFLDCPHTVHVHRKWFRSSNAKEVRAEVRTGDDWVQVEFFGERDAESVVSRLLFPSGGEMTHTDRFLMPTTSSVDYIFGLDRHFIITSQCTPISSYETEVYTVITFRFGRIAPLVRLFFQPLARRIIRQDVEVLAAQTEQLKRFGGEEFRFVESDLIGPQILRLWKKAGASNVSERNGAGADTPMEPRREILLRF